MPSAGVLLAIVLAAAVAATPAPVKTTLCHRYVFLPAIASTFFSKSQIDLGAVGHVNFSSESDMTNSLLTSLASSCSRPYIGSTFCSCSTLSERGMHASQEELKQYVLLHLFDLCLSSSNPVAA
ncbi:hypothetical protein GUJ93_ZPchr0009g1570 [Zizania palustris]|uniref:Secreted protein n=1 Tax=Zizania palustris TaxID=103762 RepID=A0A8J5S3Q6_ZIZPA|nr:hypothetical protein GUJ93_ZPchr0009g1570 [Zizania palustris]